MNFFFCLRAKVPITWILFKRLDFICNLKSKVNNSKLKRSETHKCRLLGAIFPNPHERAIEFLNTVWPLWCVCVCACVCVCVCVGDDKQSDVVVRGDEWWSPGPGALCFNGTLASESPSLALHKSLVLFTSLPLFNSGLVNANRNCSHCRQGLSFLPLKSKRKFWYYSVWFGSCVKHLATH